VVQCAGPLQHTRKRKSQKELNKCGNISIIINGEESLLCVIRCEVLAVKLFQGKFINMTSKNETQISGFSQCNFFLPQRKAEVVNKSRLDSSWSYQQKW
jgi:hypothetical protein